MPSRATRYAAAGAAGVISLAGAGYSLATQVREGQLIAATLPAQLAPLPPGTVPPNLPQPGPQPPLSESERTTLADALWRDPLDPKLINLLYANAVRSGASPAALRRDRAVLEQLGWQHTPTQVNLLFQALLENRFDAALDRIDGLARRQQLTEVAFTMLMAMEALPEVRPQLISRLLMRPRWRSAYLAAIRADTPSETLAGRMQTMHALLGSRPGVTREEIAPYLVALIETGQARAARTLWTRWSHQSGDDSLIGDPRFAAAATLAASGAPLTPFDWQLAQGPGYSSVIGPDGVVIDWDRRGLPTFLTQQVAVRPGADYALTIAGTSSSGRLAELLTPALVCGEAMHPFNPTGRTDEVARFVIASLPTGCDMGRLTIAGTLDAGRGNVSMTLSQINLQEAR